MIGHSPRSTALCAATVPVNVMLTRYHESANGLIAVLMMPAPTVPTPPLPDRLNHADVPWRCGPCAPVETPSCSGRAHRPAQGSMSKQPTAHADRGYCHACSSPFPLIIWFTRRPMTSATRGTTALPSACNRCLSFTGRRRLGRSIRAESPSSTRRTGDGGCPHSRASTTHPGSRPASWERVPSLDALPGRMRPWNPHPWPAVLAISPSMQGREDSDTRCRCGPAGTSTRCMSASATGHASPACRVSASWRSACPSSPRSGWIPLRSLTA